MALRLQLLLDLPLSEQLSAEEKTRQFWDVLNVGNGSVPAAEFITRRGAGCGHKQSFANGKSGSGVAPQLLVSFQRQIDISNVICSSRK